MKNNRKKLGFTLVELMVVIAIIGILATLIMVTLDNTKSTARNTRRLADIKELQLALKLFYNDNGFYPTAITAGTSISRNGVNYLLRVPENPKPWNDGTCLNQDYRYQQIESGQRYTITFCLSDSTDDLSSGSKLATANGILNCAEGYVGIPGSATFQTNDFCVMKYEAKCACSNATTGGLTTPFTSNLTYNNSSQPCTGSVASCAAPSNLIPVSTSSGPPIGNVSQTAAKTYCQNIGGHLMTNAEWMTIARNLEQVTTNWYGGEGGTCLNLAGAVGTNYMLLGNYGLSVFSPALDGSSACGSGGTTAIYTRDLKLSTGETIKDISGNVAEWVDATCAPGTGTGNYYGTLGPHEWTNSNFDDYERAFSGPSNSSWNHDRGIGQYRGCTANNNVFLRGGHLNSGFDAGIFDLRLNQDNDDVNSLWGFRCVK